MMDTEGSLWVTLVTDVEGNEAPDDLVWTQYSALSRPSAPRHWSAALSITLSW